MMVRKKCVFLYLLSGGWTLFDRCRLWELVQVSAQTIQNSVVHLLAVAFVGVVFLESAAVLELRFVQVLALV